MSAYIDKTTIEVLNDSNVASTKASINKILGQMTRCKEKIQRHIQDSYVEFMQSAQHVDQLLIECDAKVKEAESVLQSVDADNNTDLRDASNDLLEYTEQLQEAILGMKTVQKILKIDDLFQAVETANGSKEYLQVLDLLSELKSLIFDANDAVLPRCDCYDPIKVKYHIQTNILQQNLQQRFERLLQMHERPFPNAKCVTLQVSKDEQQLQETVTALFQVRFSPVKICDFLLENCIEPIIQKPVSLELLEEDEHIQLTLSYSLKPLASSDLRPGYKQVFENLRKLLQCLSKINVPVTKTQHVFNIFGEHIKTRLLELLVEECLMRALPETMDELNACTLVVDVLDFENLLAEMFLINAETDRALSEFAEQFPVYFKNNFSKKILETAKDIMQKDLQDMTQLGDKHNKADVELNPTVFPSCMISRSTLELIKLLERLLRQPKQPDNSSFVDDGILHIIADVLNLYIVQVPKLHEKLLESIPQQSALFYNNCMFLAQWVTKNADANIPTFPLLVKSLQAAGNKCFDEQVAYQQKMMMGILRDFDLSEAVNNYLGATPIKVVRQCLRQLDLLRNVWQNVLPDVKYNKTFCELLNDFCNEVLKRILAMEDISTTVGNELSEIIALMLEKVPTLFKEKHQVVHISCWMKLEQLKMLLNASLQEITEQWCDGVGILTANYKAEEIRHLIRALFQNTDRRATALAKIV